MMITIIDYGSGNLRSAEKAFERIGFDARVTADRGEVADAQVLVLPGVGAFGDCMRGLRERDLIEPVRKHIESGRPFLGICVGLQLLFERSEENPGAAGLGILRGEVKRFERTEERLKIPHMGWNQIDHAVEGNGSPLWNSIPRGSSFYFVHSYYAAPQDADVVVGWTEYGTRFASVIVKENVMATQFHPEKSQKVGLQLVKNFAQWAIKQCQG